MKKPKRLGACQNQYDLFKEKFGQSVVPTRALCKKHAEDFDFAWIPLVAMSQEEWFYYSIQRHNYLDDTNEPMRVATALAFFDTWKEFRSKKVVD